MSKCKLVKIGHSWIDPEMLCAVTYITKTMSYGADNQVTFLFGNGERVQEVQVVLSEDEVMSLLYPSVEYDDEESTYCENCGAIFYFLDGISSHMKFGRELCKNCQPT